MRGKTVHEVLLKQAADGNEQILHAVAEQLHRQDIQIIGSGNPLEDVEVQGLWGTDPRSWYRINKYPLPSANGDTIGMLGIVRDVTDRKEYEMRLEYQALHDHLTGLPNRHYLLKTIADAIAQSQHTATRLAVLFCDLDLFKSVNDTHGHDFGDKCLMELTRRIQAELPAQDFVARFGGNEFVILSDASLDEAKAKADVLLETVSQELVVDDAVVKIQTSIGIALLNPEHKNPSELIRNADAALYQAKERGRNRAEVFDASLQNAATKRAQMDVALRFAQERDELTLVYQPKVSVIDGSIKGFELLLRWTNPRYGLIPPVEFIPVAESSGLVVPIGLWVLEEACKQLSAWQARYPGADDCTMAVNVSMRQLLQSPFLEQVTAILERTGVAPNSIELELTETSAMANPLQTIENLSMLKRLGLRVALDDFGTGYSSLAYLQKLPVDVLKIDKEFVRDLNSNPGDIEIVRLILALAQTLNLETVAEGVETKEDLIELKKMGCYLAQGFIFSQAVTADEAEEMLRSGRRFSVP
jgi:diguanylate cyclase (GGDEF)-like protein